MDERVDGQTDTDSLVIAHENAHLMHAGLTPQRGCARADLYFRARLKSHAEQISIIISPDGTVWHALPCPNAPRSPHHSSK